MKKIILGTSELTVSEICLGTMNFGWKEPQENSIERLEQYVGSGGNFIDTANVYSRREAEGMDFYGKDFDKYVDGTSERLIGNWVKDKELIVVIILYSYDSKNSHHHFQLGIFQHHLYLSL